MRTYILIFHLLTGMISEAQIPNSNFEEWIFGTWSLEPDGWSTSNNQLQTSVAQDQDSYEGQYAMRVIAVPDGVGSYGSSTCFVPIDYIPASLDFYVRTFIDFGSVTVSVAFYHEEFLFNAFSWSSSETMDEWTFVSLPLVQNEPVLTHAVISVEAFVGDFTPGEAEIAVDAMGFEQTTDARQPQTDDFEIFPNPASTSFEIRGISAGSEIRIFDAVGREVMNRQPVAPLIQQDVSRLKPGIYFVGVRSERGNASTRRLVIRR